jgi:hypothetical protein
MSHAVPTGPHEAEFRAICQSHRGLVSRLCNVAGIDENRVAKCLAPQPQHHLRPDEFLALLAAGYMLGHEPLIVLSDRVTAVLAQPAPAPAAAETNGRWFDEALEMGEQLLGAMRECRDEVAELTIGERTRLRNTLQRTEVLIRTIRLELDQTEGKA